MKPVAIFRHSPTEGPGYFATFLAQHNIPLELIKIDAGDPAPTDVSAYSGLVFMGGPMSVNDGLPWIASELSLIREAVRQDIPVLGHCLGGQLIAKALGGAVTKNPVKEIGWGEVSIVDQPDARAWFGDAPAKFLSFHWHGETFSLPPGATRILESPYCANQAYVLGKHLGMQCHVEMTREMIETWSAVGQQEIAEAQSPAVQTTAQMAIDMDTRLAALNAVAAQLYTHWMQGLKA
ncbi:MAG: glutamine amidotransferase [Betaproteobacteria bacterium RBG_16_58_11]|nr:MAG: glutamine amidotransferase [Betaproteobacteria bacterium RBG_16_58_11]